MVLHLRVKVKLGVAISCDVMTLVRVKLHIVLTRAECRLVKSVQ